jgi:hypothetical protein
MHTHTQTHTHTLVELVFKSCTDSNTMKGTEMGWECNTYEEEEYGIQDFGVSTRKKETTWKTR